MIPIIFHIDMNSYFATVAQQENPEYRGRPLGVCEHLGGIIIAASVEAKRWGIKTGTPVWEARKIYPKIILTQTLPNAYRTYIKKVIAVVSDYTDKVEQASIDEMYADMTKATNVRRHSELVQPSEEPLAKNKRDPSDALRMTPEMVDPYEEAVKIALEIKRRMKTEVGDYLTCSIGIANNKLVAKIASDLKKPDGIVVVVTSDMRHETRENQMEPALCFTKDELYQKLKLTDIPGIARRQEKNLNELGIRTLIDLKNFPVAVLVKKFGINGYHLHKMGQLEGSWKAKVHLDAQIKSIGHMYTLPFEYRQPKFFMPVLYKLCEMVAKRLRKQGLMGNIIHFFWRGTQSGGFSAGGGPGSAWGESKKLGFYVYDGREIFLQAEAIHKHLLEQNKSANFEYKLIGVTVAGLRPQNNQLSLFGSEEKLKRVVGALDKVNLKYGDFTLFRTPIIYAKNVFQDSVGFGRVKEK